MSPDPPNEVDVFSAAIEIADHAKRCAYLDQACGNDAALRASVDELLTVHDSAGDFLNSPPLGGVIDQEDEFPGATIGRYRLIERIGEGGFGVVWKAEQQQPVKRQVAFKIIRLGMDTRQIVARFEIERQALAMMNHVGVATVLDAGTTDRGRPFFVMELVHGKAIDQYCADEQLSLRQRLELFVQVCQAVHHAHRKGILHRDLKPSNILVADQDGVAVAKVIDFGIARLMLHATLDRGPEPLVSGDTASKPLATSTQLIGTPEYMSPEQIAGSADIDSRADIYVLGGVLFKLLVGVSPHGGIPIRGNLTGMRQVLLERSATPPSRRLQELLRSGNASELGEVSVREMKGDLDWITLKALAKDRSDRYDSVAELARDVQRYLDCAPVSAAPASTVYRARKFVRRNYLGFIVSTLLLVSLVSATVALTLNRAKGRERARALREAEKTQRVGNLLEGLINAAGPEHGRAASIAVRRQVDEFAATFGAELESQPLVEARLRRTIGRLYMKLREYPKARLHLERARDLRLGALAAADPLFVQSQVDLAWCYYFLAKVGESEILLQKALPKLRIAPPSDELILALDFLGRIRGHQEEHDEKSSLRYEAWEISKELYGLDHVASLRLQSRLAVDVADEGEALRLASDALERMREMLPVQHIDVAMAKFNVARVLLRARRFSEAESLLREAIATGKRLIGEDSLYVVQYLGYLARTQNAAGAHADAMKTAQEALAKVERASGASDLHWLNVRKLLSDLLAPNDPFEAAELLRKVGNARHQYFPDRRASIEAQAFRRAALLYSRANRHDKTLTCLRERLPILRKNENANSREIAWSLGALAHLMFEAGQSREAMTLLRTELENSDSELDRLAIGTLSRNLAFLLRRSWRVDEAEQQYQSSLRLVPKSDYPFATVQTLHELADLLLELQKFDEAERHLRQALEICDASSVRYQLLRLDLLEILITKRQTDQARSLFELGNASANLFRSRVARGAQQIGKARIALADADDQAVKDLSNAALKTLKSGRPSLRLRSRLRIILAANHVQTGRWQKAETVLLQGEKSTNTPLPPAICRRRILRQLVALYDAWGKPDEAQRWRLDSSR